MAFGFVVVKFALFVRQLGFILNQEGSSPVVPNHGYSASIGITLVGLGIIVTFLAFLQYKRTERQLNTDSFSSSSPLSILLTLAIILVGLLLMIYLVASV
jgi:putative membrane protein